MIQKGHAYYAWPFIFFVDRDKFRLAERVPKATHSIR